ncbi:MAG: glycogen synthase GlgA [Candidatus Binatia bacterium]
MKILIVSPEIYPLAKTGGLADVASALARTLAAAGAEVALAMPAYQLVLQSGFSIEETGMELETPLGTERIKVTVLKTRLAEPVPVFLIKADRFFQRDGIYGTPAGDYPDNLQRFTFFCKAALALAARLAPWDVIHCNDWQSALIPVFKTLRSESYPELQASKTLLTIHNLGYQGEFPASQWDILGLSRHYFTPQYLEFYGKINLLKGGILFADALTTVSRKYASEIATPEYGCGLDGVIRMRQSDLFGILNGVDYDEWSPENDPHIKQKYGSRDLRGKSVCKQNLQELFRLPVRAEIPLFGIVSRLVDQKGLDILLEVLETLLRLDLQLVILGTGEQKYQELLLDLARHYPANLGVRIGFANDLAHKIEAGVDLFLMPSKFEPCGLNQMYSLKYGTIPIVRATGGLDDTIEDFSPLRLTGNGIKFSEYSGAVLLESIKRGIAIFYHKQAWRRLIKNAMSCDFSWKKSAAEYLSLYEKLRGV